MTTPPRKTDHSTHRSLLRIVVDRFGTPQRCHEGATMGSRPRSRICTSPLQNKYSPINLSTGTPQTGGLTGCVLRASEASSCVQCAGTLEQIHPKTTDNCVTVGPYPPARWSFANSGRSPRCSGRSRPLRIWPTSPTAQNGRPRAGSPASLSLLRSCSRPSSSKSRDEANRDLGTPGSGSAQLGFQKDGLPARSRSDRKSVV